MKEYNILWFDDEYKSLEILKEKASLNNICHKGFEDAATGIAELERNLMFYDAVIVDGLFIDKPLGPVGESALVTVARTLDRIADRKKIPWFILSGQPSFTRENNKIAELYKDGKVYDKTNDQDIDELWRNIKSAADIQIDTQIRHDHCRVFDTFTEKYFGQDSAKSLISILKKENIINAFDDPELYFNPLRKLLEDIFKACNKWGLLPDAFVIGSVALNESGRFFSGSIERNYQIIHPEFPGKVIANNFKNILSVSQSASHRADVDKFVRKNNTPYLLMSITYQLMDILIWLKNYVDKNPDIEKNKTIYVKMANIDSLSNIIGVIEQDNYQNYHCGEFLLNSAYVSSNFKLGDRIRILQWAENIREKTKAIYPKFASKFEKLD